MQRICFAFLVLFFSCKTQNNVDINTGIIMEVGMSYKVDLVNQVYTLDYKTNPIKIKFQLSNEERIQIVDEYFSLELDDLPENCSIKDECTMQPKIFTTLNIYANNKKQEIKIDNGCDKFSFIYNNKVERVKKFIKLIKKIILSKPEILKAPKSTIIYI